ncbi:hypothetical protein M089_4690 [Bacteroides ovatus str. 3725 D9 iii]|nr:hypothetical protein M088_0958 [Bacteroides ovatus str. 3725 D1 iv]KDS19786.1 hypothetical protein M088_6126 [Bacteroides ovatus str. 3725 D1 iv]KDS24362.1 hypothetical protein M089_4690 [Bacteroides ovatus str. 3725 D9 iii]
MFNLTDITNEYGKQQKKGFIYFNYWLEKNAAIVFFTLRRFY